MLNILKGIRTVIERFIVNRFALTETAHANDTILNVQSTKRYLPGEQVVVLNEITNEGEVHEVERTITNTQLELTDGLTTDYPVGPSYVEKLIGNQWLNRIYIGDPPVISHYPSMTIAASTRESDWFTIDSTKEHYEIDISTYVLAAQYEDAYEFLLTLTKAVERSLFRSFYPLIQPYYTTPLTRAARADDTIIRVEDSDVLQCSSFIWIESYANLVSNKPIRMLGDGTVELAFAVGEDFDVGAKVIRPGRHFMDSRPRTTDYGAATKAGALLRASRISYFIEEEIIRSNPFVDPLTF